MAKLAAGLCTLSILLCLCRDIAGYPVVDFSSEDLLKGSDAMTRRRRQTDPSYSDGCSYPGVVAVTVSNRVLYTGLYQSGTIRVPNDAVRFLKIANGFNTLTVYGGDGRSTAAIAQNALQATNNKDGTSTITLSTDFSSLRCPSNDATLYNNATMSVDLFTCKVASYGGDHTIIHTYDGRLQTDPLSWNALYGCCANVLPNILSKEPKLAHPSATDVKKFFTCASISGAICNGDIGAPIYCTDGKSGQMVVVGMVDSGTCNKGENFAAIDFTGRTLAGFSS